MRESEISIHQVYAKSPNKNHVTLKTDVFYIDDTRSKDLLDLNDYVTKIDKTCTSTKVVTDKFSKFG